MAIGSAKLNIFSQSAGMQAINPTKAVMGKSSGEVAGGSSAGNNPFGSNLFSGNTVGLNSMQTGDSVYTPAQAGKSAGISRIIGNG